MNYTLVRKSREGRQSSVDTIHFIGDDDTETKCGELNKKQVKAVRSLSIFMGENNICSDCAEHIDKNL